MKTTQNNPPRTERKFMRVAVLLFILTSGLLNSCGGGGDKGVSASADANSDIGTTEVLVSGFSGVVPRYIYDLASNTLVNPPDTLYDWSLTVRFMGAHPYDTSNFDARDNGYRSRIDSANFEVVPIRGAGQHSVLERRFAGLPMFSDGRAILMSFDARLGEQQLGANVAQASLIGYIWDGGKNSFAFVFPFFDNRYSTFVPYVSNDTYTAFVSAPFANSTYATVMKGRYSHNLAITQANMRNIIADLNTKCVVDCVSWQADLTQYKFTSIGILHEVFFVADKTQRLISELEVTGFQLAR